MYYEMILNDFLNRQDDIGFLETVERWPAAQGVGGGVGGVGGVGGARGGVGGGAEEEERGNGEEGGGQLYAVSTIIELLLEVLLRYEFFHIFIYSYTPSCFIHVFMYSSYIVPHNIHNCAHI